MSEKKWKFITLAIAILGVLSPFIYPIIFDPKKSLSYEVLYQTNISTKHIELENLKMTINDELINDLYITTIQVINDGTTPITSMDYEESLTIIPDKNTSIYSANIIDTNPNDIKLKHKTEKNEITISPLLLNPMDYFTVTIYSSKNGKYNVGGRIIGVSNIIEKTHNENINIRTYLRYFSASVLFGMMGYFMLIFLRLRRSSCQYRYLYLIITFAFEYGAIMLLKQAGVSSIYIVLPYMLIFVLIGYFVGGKAYDTCLKHTST